MNQYRNDNTLKREEKKKMPTFTFVKPIEDVEEPILLEEDWYLSTIKTTPTIAPNKAKQADPESEKAGDNLEIALALVGGEAEGRRFKLYLPWPSLEDEDKYDGIGMKVSDAKMERIADFTTKFGGVSEGTDILLEENMQGYVYVTRGLDQQGQRMINNVDPFAGFKSVEELETEGSDAPVNEDDTVF
jgi:hypothetical protein